MHLALVTLFNLWVQEVYHKLPLNYYIPSLGDGQSYEPHYRGPHHDDHGDHHGGHHRHQDEHVREARHYTGI